MEKFKSFVDEGLKYNGHIDDEFDVIIVGSGPGGYLAAENTGKSGLKTLIVEKEFWGGVCLNVGCIPTKAMIASTEMLTEVEHLSTYGLVGNFEALSIDYNESWKKMHERKAAVVKQISSSVKMLMKMSKCTIEEGEAKFLGAHVITVNDKVYYGKKMIIATGSSARKLGLPGFERGYASNKVITSNEAINWAHQRPESIVIVGGGVIGVEFAEVFASSKSKVTIIQDTNGVLPFCDKDIVKEVTKHLTKKGVEFIFNAVTTGLNDNDELTYKVGDEEKTIKADVYLLAVGRTPNSQGLADLGISVSPRGGVLVDEKMRTNVKDVYAIGDVTAINMLAHVAYRHAMVAVADIIGEKDNINNNLAIPACIYTSPEIAVAGMTEEQAKLAGYDAFSSKYAFAFLGKAIAAKKTDGFLKLVVDKVTGKVLGAHAIGANVTDYISELAMVIDKGMTVRDIADTIHPHPTFSEIIWEAARNAAHKLFLEENK